ncbi:hypothetical protein [Komarekiella delphini-convector]|uniref:hypothetical protein n=1 Tax=Komarekiella delphini-convector TaxID=3050158 RepID=UPI001CD84F6F|nr:hypothetical protein [Komarekiella delphini-convector]
MKGQPGGLFLSKLGSLVIEIAELESGEPTVIEIAHKLQKALDVEPVTKKFYKEFQEQHQQFLQFVKGISNETDRRWYTSVILNRLMFVYFLQRKGFIDNQNLDYLQNKLEQSQQKGEDLFYDEFLQALFFESFAKPETDRDLSVQNLVGKVKYLNGGLFLQHRIEKDYKISIADEAFEQVLNLFKQQPGKGRLPLYEGKMIHRFTHLYAEPKYWVDEQEGRKALLGRNQSDNAQKLDYQNYRLGFRAIARNTDARTLIVGAVPKNVFCGNSILVFSEVTHISSVEMVFTQAIFNSFVLDFYARQMVSANINMFYIYQLPVPRLTKSDRYFNDIVQRAAKLICTTPEFDELAQEVGLVSHEQGVTNETERAQLRAELDGMIAHLYGLTEEEFSYILTTFPIVPESVKQAALEAYRIFALQLTNV